MKYIGLLDCNNFFVSCERLFRPDLVDKPVVVLSSNDGCIVARSAEVKALAVPMGIPYFQVRDLLEAHNTAVFSSHFALYRDISRRIFSILGQQVACLEQYSIDEAFFVYEGEDPLTYIKILKATIERDVGIPVAIGMASTKTQAKYASNCAKQTSGVCKLDTDEFVATASSSSISQIWGVGSNRNRDLVANGINTVGDLMTADSRFLAERFGVFGTRLQSELQGKLVHTVTSNREPQKSIMSSRSFKKASTDKALLTDALAYHVRHLAEDLRASNTFTGKIRVSLHTAYRARLQSLGSSKEVSLIEKTFATNKLLAYAKTILEELYVPNLPYQKVGVTFSQLEPVEYANASLFAEEKNTNSKLWRTLDNLNTHYGNDTVRIGSFLQEAKWRGQCASQSPAYISNWNDLPIARA